MSAAPHCGKQRAAAAGNLEAFFTADEAFHAEIFAISGHPGAWVAGQRMKLQLDRLRRLSLPDTATVTLLISGHSRIVDALEAASRLRAKHPDFFVEEVDGRPSQPVGGAGRPVPIVIPAARSACGRRPREPDRR